jgi:OOP family OmpA-OmpF porin
MKASCHKFSLQLLLMIAFLGSFSQQAPKWMIKQAEKDLKTGYYYDAAEALEIMLKKDSANAHFHYLLGQSYFMMRDYDAAKPHFIFAAQSTLPAKDNALFFQAMVEKMNGNCPSAIPLFKQLQSSADPEIKAKAAMELKGCMLHIPEQEVHIDHLSKSINSNYTDLSPSYHRGDLYFTSIRSDTIITPKPDSLLPLYVMKLYSSRLRDTGYTRAFPVSTFSVPGKHLANIAHSPDKQSLVFTICDGVMKPTNCNLWFSYENDDEWSPAMEMEYVVNFNTYNTTQPYLALMPDSSEILFFSSDRPGGSGGMDIWYSKRTGKKKFSEPRNLGAIINTPFDEITPFYSGENRTLYFSSNGYPSFGGLDIFKSTGTPLHFSAVTNIGKPYNSTYDDTYFRFAADTNNGYFVSNRPGIYSVKSATCCDDIFGFRTEKKFHPMVRLSAVNTDGDALDKVKFTITGDNNTFRLDTTFSDMVKIALPDTGRYTFKAIREGFFATEMAANLDTNSLNDLSEMAFLLKPIETEKAYALGNIYYEYNKTEFRPDSKYALDQLVVLLKENPAMVVEVASHTDALGDEAYNMKLSQARAESCVNYLLSCGIETNRLVAKGYGETKPIVLCNFASEKDGENKDAPCYIANRRTEFKVLSVK